MVIWLSALLCGQSRSPALADCTTLAPFSYDRDDDDGDDGDDGDDREDEDDGDESGH